MKGAIYYVAIATVIFSRVKILNMLFSHVKISSFRAKAHLVFHWCLYNNLECLTFEIFKPRSKPFLVSSWYRPPQSSPDLFSTFERIIAENLELYLMGDLNCNLLSEVVSNNSSHLLNIIDNYGLTPLITEPTRVTQYSSTLIDLCLKNSPDIKVRCY